MLKADALLPDGQAPSSKLFKSSSGEDIRALMARMSERRVLVRAKLGRRPFKTNTVADGPQCRAENCTGPRPTLVLTSPDGGYQLQWAIAEFGIARAEIALEGELSRQQPAQLRVERD